MVYISVSTTLLFAASLSQIVAAHPQSGSKKRPDIEIDSKKQPATANCSKQGNYAAKTYSAGQVKAALIAAVDLKVDNKQIGKNNYPHAFGNGEALPFQCGSSKQEFPIMLSGQVYTGGVVTQEPDRIVFEYVQKKDKVSVAMCGVMRHGPKGFVKC